MNEVLVFHPALTQRNRDRQTNCRYRSENGYQVIQPSLPYQNKTCPNSSGKSEQSNEEKDSQTYDQCVAPRHRIHVVWLWPACDDRLRRIEASRHVDNTAEQPHVPRRPLVCWLPDICTLTLSLPQGRQK